MTAQTYSFEDFANQEWYRNLNVRLVDLAGLKPGQRIIDLACGPGSVTKVIVEKVKGARNTVVIGVDMSAAALKQAREELSTRTGAVVQFVEGRAEELSKIVREKVDAVVCCNAIHMLEDKDRVVAEVSRSLAPGGAFAFNTAFFNGTQAPETEQFYRRWMLRALRILKAEGLSPTKEKVMARQTLTPEQYEELLERHGFKVQTKELQPVGVPLEGWQDISSFEDFAQGALPGIPVDKASQVLRDAVAQVFQEFELTVVPRYWLAMVAVRQ